MDETQVLPVVHFGYRKGVEAEVVEEESDRRMTGVDIAEPWLQVEYNSHERVPVRRYLVQKDQYRNFAAHMGMDEWFLSQGLPWCD